MSPLYLGRISRQHGRQVYVPYRYVETLPGIEHQFYPRAIIQQILSGAPDKGQKAQGGSGAAE